MCRNFFQSRTSVLSLLTVVESSQGQPKLLHALVGRQGQEGFVELGIRVAFDQLFYGLGA